MKKSNSMRTMYPLDTLAEAAIKKQRRSGIGVKKRPIVRFNIFKDEHLFACRTTGERVKVWGKAGAFLGGLWGLLFGSALSWIPGLGPLLLTGSLVSWIVSATAGAIVVGGLGVIGAGLYSLGALKHNTLGREKVINDSGKTVQSIAAETVRGPSSSG